MTQDAHNWLAGDIGGTKTDLALYSLDKGPRSPSSRRKYPSGDFPSLKDLIQRFLDEEGASIAGASLGIAGPVVGKRVELTNLPWVVDAAELEQIFGLADVQLFNDLVGLAQGIPQLPEESLRTLQEGHPDPRGPRAVIAPGTGLGQAYMIRDGDGYRAHASEGGHADFAPADDLEAELFRFLRGSYGHVSYERVASGRGLPNIYRFLKSTGRAEEPEWLARRLAEANDPTPVIVQTALDDSEPCGICAQTVRIFIEVLGREAGNAALRVVATGGVFLAGGIPPRILPLLEDERFINAFRDKGRLRDFMRRVPVKVVLESDVAIMGAACMGLKRLAELQGNGSEDQSCRNSKS
ncbi:MAG: glucokinase [Candidatus Eisenbacteria bacterium]|nr:glucokinase [Candidatus Eisenbacteria bacterium]